MAMSPLTRAAGAVPYSDLIIFGDSLSDTGNIKQATLGLYPFPPYYEGRFSNGPVWVDYLGAGLGLDADAALLGGGNLAFGGAETGPANAGFPPSLLDQVNAFQNIVGPGGADPDALYVVYGGGNDLLGAGSANPNVVVDTAVGNISSIIRDLVADGADSFLVPNLPNLGATPSVISRGAASVESATALTTLFNSALETALQNLESELTANLIRFDVFGLLEALLANAGVFGITNTTEPCYVLFGTPCADPNSYAFWDDIHPTAPVHALLGIFAYATVNGAPQPAYNANAALTFDDVTTTDFGPARLGPAVTVDAPPALALFLPPLFALYILRRRPRRARQAGQNA